MRAVSAAFLSALSGSHKAPSRARVCTDWQTGTSPSGEPVDLIGGDVSFDASADIRATAEITLPPRYWPASHTDLVTPYGHEVYLERGVQLAGGSATYVGLGYYRIESVEQDDDLDIVRVGASDRMAGLVEARLLAPVQFADATSVLAAFNTLVLEVYPLATIEFDFDAANTLFSGSHIADEERFAFLNTIVTSLGKIWHWDYRGVLVVRDAPDATQPVWSVKSGAGGVLISSGRERSRTGVYNAVVVSGETPGGVSVRAVAYDLNPSSPTYWHGPFGKVPRFFSSPLITTQQGAASAAEKILRRYLGLPYSIDFASIANPALEVYDPVTIESEIHVMDKIRIPLDVEQAMTGSSVDQTVVEIGVDL